MVRTTVNSEVLFKKTILMRPCIKFNHVNKQVKNTKNNSSLNRLSFANMDDPETGTKRTGHTSRIKI